MVELRSRDPSERLAALKQLAAAGDGLRDTLTQLQAGVALRRRSPLSGDIVFVFQ